MHSLHTIYSQPQLGRGLPVYAGWRRQSGGGILGSIARFAMPILKNVGKRALNVAAKTAKDVVSGKRGVGAALKKHGKREAISAIHNLVGTPPSPTKKSRKVAKRRPKRRKGINKRKNGDIFN